MRVILSLLLLVGCMPAAPKVTAPMPKPAGHVFSTPVPEVVVKGDLSPLDSIARTERLAELRARRNAKPVAFETLALLRDAPEAAEYRMAPRSRAFVMGWPSASCPALASAKADTPREAAGRATEACQRQLSGWADCGCRLMALDGVLLAPPEQFAHARAVAAELLIDGQRMTLIAEEASDSSLEQRAWWLLDPTGPLARLILKEDQATLAFVTGTNGTYRAGRTLTGTAQKLGLRRGTLALRISFAAGTLTLGLEPEELGQSRPID